MRLFPLFYTYYARFENNLLSFSSNHDIINTEILAGASLWALPLFALRAAVLWMASQKCPKTSIFASWYNKKLFKGIV